jgi:chromatin remodeling complex protein RSC6
MAKSTKSAAKSVKKSSTKTAPRKKTSNALMRPVTPSPALAQIVGSKPLPRTEVTKKVWEYIKKNDLQDKKNRRIIKADPALKAVFGGKASVDMLEMTRHVTKHLKA